MTQRVIIKGGQQNGAQLTNAASEATLLKILASLQQLNGKQQPNGSPPPPPPAGSPSGGNNPPSPTGHDNFDDQDTRGLLLKTLGMLGSLVHGMGYVVGATMQMGDRLSGMVNEFREMTNVGVILGDSFTSVAATAHDVRIPLHIFMDTIKKNNLALAGLGGTVSKGATIFNGLTKQLQKSGFYDSLMMLGYSMKDISEVMGTYVDIQTRAGKAQNMSVAQLTASTAAFAGQLDRWSKLGFSRDKMLAGIDRESRDERLMALSSQWDPSKQMDLLSTLSALDQISPKMAESIRTMISKFGQPDSGDMGTLSLANIPGLSKILSNVSSGQANASDILPILKKYANSMPKMDPRMNAMLLGKGMFTPDAFYPILQSIRNIDFKTISTSTEQQEAIEKTNRSILLFDKIVQDITGSFMVLFYDSGILDVVGTFTAEMSKEFRTLSSTLSDFVRPLVKTMGSMALDLSKEITKAFNIFNLYISDEKSGDGLFTRLGNAIDLIFIQPLIPTIRGQFNAILNSDTFKEVKGEISETINEGVSGGVTSAIATFRAELDNSISAIGTVMIGTFAGLIATGITMAVVSGAAPLLSSFANPTILAGAAVLSGSIALLAGAVSGSVWLLGTAIPTLTGAFKGLQELDGDALKSSASGMFEMSKSLLALSLLSVPANFANIISGLSSFLTLGDSPLEQVVKFSKLDINSENVERNAKALNLYVASIEGITTTADRLKAGFSFDWDTKMKIPELDISAFGSSADKLVRKMKDVMSKYNDLSGVLSSDRMQLVVDTGISVNGNSIGVDIKATQEKTNSILSDMSSAINDIRNKLIDTEPVDIKPVTDTGKEQLKQLTEIQSGITSLYTTMNDLLIVLQSVHNISRRSLTEMKNQTMFN